MANPRMARAGAVEALRWRRRRRGGATIGRELALLLALLLGGGQQCRAVPAGQSAAGLDAALAHASTGVASLQARGLDGRGVSIAVMDSGLNYRHPAFGACSAPGDPSPSCRVVGGRDVLGKSTDWRDLAGAQPDDDPMDCANGTHGTQVASVAAGDASYLKDNPWRGVAFASSLLAYKVTGSCEHPTAVSTNASFAAIRRAAETDGADVLNLSFGDFRAGGFADTTYAALLGRAMRRGTLAAVAAGNNGLMGPFFTEGSVVAPDVLSVASVDLTLSLSAMRLGLALPAAAAATAAPARRAAGQAKPPQQAGSAAFDALGVTLPPSATLAAAGRLAAQQAALRLPLRVVPLQPLHGCGRLAMPRALLVGQVALVKRGGGCTVAAKAAAAAAAGAAAVIVFSNSSKPHDFASLAMPAPPSVPVWGLQLQQGEALAAAADAAAKQPKQRQQWPRLVSLKQLAPQPYNVSIAPSWFSSWGPSVTLDMHPSIAAPGSQLRAAAAGSDFTLVEGTSYASPYVAGALALWRQAHAARLPQLQAAMLTAARAGAVAAAAAAAAAAPAGSRQQRPAADATGAAAAKAAATAAAAHQKQYHSAATRPGGGGDSIRPGGAHRPDAAATATSAAPAEEPVTLQQAAFSAFVSTARPVEWVQRRGWAQPVARMGAGLVQADAAIHNPAVISPNRLLLRSNQHTQTLGFAVTNTGAAPLTYVLGHTPAAAVLAEQLWFAAEPEQLLQPLAASVAFASGGRPAREVTVPPGGSVALQVTFTQPKALMARGYVYSGYLTLTPKGQAGKAGVGAGSAPLPSLVAGAPAAAPADAVKPATAAGGARAGSKPPQQQQQRAPQLQLERRPMGARPAEQAAGAAAVPVAGGAAGPAPPPHAAKAPATAVTPRAVPLVLPYQGFSTNYTTLPLLPAPDAARHPAETRELRSLLHVCFATQLADNATDDALPEAEGAESVLPPTQDGTLRQAHVDACMRRGGVASELTTLPLREISDGDGQVMLAAALLRPALRLSLMLFEAADCRAGGGHSIGGGAKARAAGCAPGAVAGPPARLAGELWRYNEPSRDYPGQLWAYVGDFDGNVTTRRDPVTQKVLAQAPVARHRMYRLQLWAVAPLAAADRAAGEVYKTWKFDVPGGFMFV